MGPDRKVLSSLWLPDYPLARVALNDILSSVLWSIIFWDCMQLAANPFLSTGFALVCILVVLTGVFICRGAHISDAMRWAGVVWKTN